MKIVHISCIAPPEIGGIGNVAAKEVASLKARGFDAELVSLTTHFNARFGNAGRIIALRHLINDADIVHLHYPFFGTAELVASLRKHGVIKRLIITLHMDATAGGIKGTTFAFYRRLFQNRILNSADTLIVSSKDYAENSSFKAFSDRVIKLPFGVDEKLFFPSSIFQLPTILFVGGMDKAHTFKGIPILLQALTRLDGLKLRLVGDGELRPVYETQAHQLGLSDRVEFLGKLDEDGLVKIYQSADILVLPSLSGAEAFGLVALEAQSCGVPVIASDLPGVRTVVEHGETGLLVLAGDTEALAKAINQLLISPETRKHMGLKARQLVLEKFTWEGHMDGLIRIYENCSPNQ